MMWEGRGFTKKEEEKNDVEHELSSIGTCMFVWTRGEVKKNLFSFFFLLFLRLLN